MAVFSPFFNFLELFGQQSAVRQLLSWQMSTSFFVGRPILCLSGQVIFFALKQSLDSQSKNYRSISRQFVMFVVGRSTLKHLKLFLNVGRWKLMWHRLTTKNRLKVNWSIRQFWQLGWLTTDRIRITLNINRLSVGKRRLG